MCDASFDLRDMVHYLLSSNNNAGCEKKKDTGRKCAQRERGVKYEMAKKKKD